MDLNEIEIKNKISVVFCWTIFSQLCCFNWTKQWFDLRKRKCRWEWKKNNFFIKFATNPRCDKCLYVANFPICFSHVKIQMDTSNCKHVQRFALNHLTSKIEQTNKNKMLNEYQKIAYRCVANIYFNSIIKINNFEPFH